MRDETGTIHHLPRQNECIAVLVYSNINLTVKIHFRDVYGIGSHTSFAPPNL